MVVVVEALCSCGRGSKKRIPPPYEKKDIKEAKNKLKQKGWELGGEVDICPGCSDADHQGSSISWVGRRETGDKK